jgi:hypothetical protein
MSSSFSEKPMPHAAGGEPLEPHYAEPLPRAVQEAWRINYRKLLGGFCFLFILTGFLLLAFYPGGFLNQWPTPFGSRIELNQAGHVFGFICLGLGAIGIVFLLSLEKRVQS